MKTPCVLRCLQFLVLGSSFRLSRGYCWQAGWNPKFIDLPKIQQLELSKVRVSWEDIVEMRDCADEFLVKYWQNNMPQGFKLSEKVPTDQNYVDIEVIPKVPYMFQVIAREDKGPVLGVDYNKSDRIEFKTSSLRPETNYKPPAETDPRLVTKKPPVERHPVNDATPQEERGTPGVVLNGALTVELLAIIVVCGFILAIIVVGIVYKCFRSNKGAGYSDPDDTADDLPDLASDKEDDLEAGETDDLKPNSWLKGDTEL